MGLYALQGRPYQISADRCRHLINAADGGQAKWEFRRHADARVFGAAMSALYGEVEGNRRAVQGQQLRSNFTWFSAETRTWRTTTASPGVVVAVAQDHDTTYWISDAPNPASNGMEAPVATRATLPARRRYSRTPKTVHQRTVSAHSCRRTTSRSGPRCVAIRAPQEGSGTDA
jgi:hypothetical protein